MVSQIQLGNLFSVNGRNVLGGTASGLDTQSLINSLVAAQQQPATDLQTKITANTAQMTAYSTLNTKLSALQTDVNALRNPPGVQNESDNIFAFRTASVTASVGSASNYMTVTALPGATIQNYTIDNITSIAAAEEQTTGVFSISDATQSVVSTTPSDSTGPNGNQFGVGTIEITNPVTGKFADVALADGDSLQAVANKFNLVSNTTGISAQIINTDTGKFQLLFTSTQTGTNAKFDLTSSAHISDVSGALAQIKPNVTEVQAATNASFNFNNVTITRQTNNITDLVNGVTFNLLQSTQVSDGEGGFTDNGTKLNVQIQPDVSSVQNAITNFANDYNDFRLFYTQQTARNPDGTPTSTALLAQSSTLDNIMNTALTQVAGIVNGLGNGNASQLADIGITLGDFSGDANNPAAGDIMSIDAPTLQSALQSNFSGVSSIFGFNFSSSSNDLQVFSHTQPLGVNNFTVSINPDTSTYQAIYTDSNNVQQTVNLTATPGSGSILLDGPDGSPFAGLQMLYTNSVPATISVTATQGVADMLYNTLTNAVDPNTGTIQAAVQGLTDIDTQYQTDITNINNQVAT